MQGTGWTQAVVLALLVLPGAAALTSGSAPVAPTSSALFHSGPFQANVSNYNWAGYAVTGPVHSVSFVQGSWIQPNATCAGSLLQYSSFWVGIDGFTSSTVEQTGTEADCHPGTASYYSWYEFYPAAAVRMTTVPVHPGDLIKASVTYVNATVGFTTTLTDTTTGKSASHSSPVTNAKRTSAEWVAEAPSSLLSVLPLADFGKAKFGKDYTGLGSTCEATISGTTGVIGSFAASSIQKLNMVALTGTTWMATTTALTPNGTSFVVTWRSAGP
ncbi:MAG: G1 family endopeptidase [Thermoplasmata archaeon]|nr:G1 family endopeptidase [Thermoplasmata archaeon]